METKHHPLLAANLLLTIGIGEEGQQGPVHARRGLDDVGDHVLFSLLVEVREGLAAELRVLLEVEVRAIGDAHELAPADGKVILDVGGALGVVGQLIGRVLAQAQVLLAEAVPPEPRHAVLDPPLVPVLVGGAAVHRLQRIDEELDLHLLELTGAKDEVARRDLVAKGLADLRDAERQLASHRLQDIVEVDEDALGRLGPEIGEGRVFFHRPHEGLEHEVELTGRSQLTLAALGAQRPGNAAVAARLTGGDGELVPFGRGTVMHPRRLVDLVGAEATATFQAVDHGVGEIVDVAARLPHRRMHQDGGVEPHHVGPALDIVPPPDPLDVLLELDAEGAVVPARSRATVDLAGLEDEAAALGQGDEGIHGH